MEDCSSSNSANQLVTDCGEKSDTLESSTESAVVSKRKLRKEKKIRLWEAGKELRRENRRKKKQEQKEKRRQRVEKLKLDAIKEGLDPSSIKGGPTRKKLKSNSMQNSSCRVGVCIDMNFSDLMSDKDLNKCIKQLSRCYSANRRFQNPLQFHVTSFCEKSTAVMDKHVGWKNWDMYIHEKSYLELDSYPKDKVVYLTAESENVLTKVEDDYLYVIGGLVDHNSLKGLCHKLAVEKGVQHARLPLGEYIEMNRRKVLSIPHVFQILGGLAQNQSWQEVLMEVLPRRNQARLKTNSSDDDDSSDNEDDEINIEFSKNSNAEATNQNCNEEICSSDTDNKEVVQ